MMTSSQLHTTNRPLWLVHFVVLFLAVTSCILYMWMERRELTNSLEVMQMQNKDRDEKMRGFEKRLIQLEKKQALDYNGEIKSAILGKYVFRTY